jgi:aryl carrier-like protein
MTDSQDGGTHGAAVPEALTEAGITAALAGLLGVPAAEVDPRANLLELGVDSIKLMTLATAWQAHGAEAPFAELAAEPTVAAWARLLRGHVAAGAA